MKKFLLMLMSLPLLMVACNKSSEPEKVLADHSLTLTSSDVVEFAAEGGNGVIAFNYTPKEMASDDKVDVAPAAVLAIESLAEWITIDSEVPLMLGSISFEVARNESTEPREAVINASYQELSFSVTIKQGAASSSPEPEPEPMPSFEGWGIVGTMNNWGAAGAIVLEESAGYFVAQGVELTASDKFKFIKDGDNAVNRGGNGLAAEVDYFYAAQQWGSDIHVSKGGTFDIYLNAKADTYYIMTQGKSPEEAIEPLAPGEDLYEVCGNFEGERVRLVAQKRFLVAKGVKFSTTPAELTVCVNQNERVYGANVDATYAVEECIAVAEGSENKIVVDVESDTMYDIYYRDDMSSLWVMPEGAAPMIWEEVTGVAFSSTNFAINLRGEGIELFFDFNCGVNAENYIIPEGVYYVNDDEDTGFNFNLENEYDLRIEGVKTKLKDGQMVIKHISGGYDIYVDVESIHNHKVQVRYTGPIGEIEIMGRPITNPE